MNLGELAIKTAQQAPGFFSMLAQQRQRENTVPHQATPWYVEQGPEGGAPVTNLGQLSVLGAKEMFGEMGNFVAPLLPLLAPYLKDMFGVDLMEGLQYGYGGNPRGMRKSQEIAGSIMAQKLQQDSKLINNLASGAGQIFDKLPQPVKEMAAKIGFTADTLPGWIASIPPETLGTIYGQLAPVFPQIDQALQQLDPSYVNPQAFVDITLAQNNGEWSDQLFQQNYQKFQSDLAKGVYGQVPATQAAQGVAFAHNMFGDQALQNPKMAQNMIAAAQAAVDNGATTDFQEALSFVASPEVAKDPSRMIGQWQQIGHIAQQYNVPVEEIRQGLVAAKQRGMDPMQGAHLVAQAGAFRRQHGQQMADRVGGQAAQTFAQFQESPAMEMLGAAVTMGYGPYARALKGAMRRGDASRIHELGQRALQDTKLQQLTGGPQAIAGRGYGSRMLGQMGYQMTQGLMMQEASDAVNAQSPRLRRQLNRALNKRNIDRTMNAMQSGDYSRARLDPRVVAMLEQNPSLVSTVAMVDPSLRRRNRVAPVSRIRRPTPPAPAEPMKQISLPHPSQQVAKPAPAQ